MPPTQIYPGSNQPASAYDFILNNQPPPVINNGGSQKKRIIMVVGGATALLMVIIIIFSLISNAGKKDFGPLISLAKQQTELIRVSEVVDTKGKNSLLRNQAISTKLSVATTQAELVAIISKLGKKIGPKDLVTPPSADVDKTIADAEATGRTDEALRSVIEKKLVDYGQSLKTALTASTTNDEKQLIQKALAGLELLRLMSRE